MGSVNDDRGDLVGLFIISRVDDNWKYSYFTKRSQSQTRFVRFWISIELHSYRILVDKISSPTLCIQSQNYSWWRHQMETFSALLDLCAGNSPVTGEFPSQRPVTPSFDVFFDLRLNKRLSKQSWCWWFETPSCSLWRHCNLVRSLMNIAFMKIPNISTSCLTHYTVIDLRSAQVYCVAIFLTCWHPSHITISLTSAQVYCVAIFLVSQEVSLNFHRCCG